MGTNLTDAVVRGLPFAERRSKLHWDSEVTGFGVRCTVGAKAFILNTRIDGALLRSRSALFPNGPWP